MIEVATPPPSPPMSFVTNTTSGCITFESLWKMTHHAWNLLMRIATGNGTSVQFPDGWFQATLAEKRVVDSILELIRTRLDYPYAKALGSLCKIGQSITARAKNYVYNSPYRPKVALADSMSIKELFNVIKSGHEVVVSQWMPRVADDTTQSHNDAPLEVRLRNLARHDGFHDEDPSYHEIMYLLSNPDVLK